MVHNPVIIIGIGEIGGVIARGCLKLGYPVVPVTRASNPQALAGILHSPQMVILAVAEKDLHPALKSLPKAWCEQLVLVQNEVLPADWAQHGLTDPTVLSVWFEKKPGRDVKVIVPSVVYGPRATLIKQSLGALGIPADVLLDEERLVFELVRKNLYILTSNVAGLKVGGTVGELWSHHEPLARAIANEVVAIQSYLTGYTLDAEALIAAMLVAFEGDPEHICMGRTAATRLERALAIAHRAGIPTPTLASIQQGLIDQRSTA
ncbi:MAG: ketopantoate reductase family protein [Thiotrichales bacterium]